MRNVVRFILLAVLLTAGLLGGAKTTLAQDSECTPTYNAETGTWTFPGCSPAEITAFLDSLNAPAATPVPTPAAIPMPAPTDMPGCVWGEVNAVYFCDQPVPMPYIDGLVASTTSVSELLAEINASMMLSSDAAIGGEWGNAEARAGLTLVGPKVVWTDWLGYTTPACLETVRAQGQWGVFYLPLGCSLEVPSVSGGGRWVSVIDHTWLEMSWAALSSGTPQSAVDFAISLWNDSYSVNAEGGVGLTLGAQKYAVVWTDWGGAPPALAFSLNADYGYGMFVLAGPGSWVLPSGGAHVFQLVP